MRLKSLALYLSTAWISVGMLTACRNAENRSAKRIGALLPLTGDAANYGHSLRNGIDLAKDEINANIPPGQARLEIMYEDSKADPKTGLAAFNKLADVDRVPAVIGSISGVNGGVCGTV